MAILANRVLRGSSFRPSPRAVVAPVTGRGSTSLPFEPEPEPTHRACPRCLRQDRQVEAELALARDSLANLEDLLGWLSEEHEAAHRGREAMEREVEALNCLIAEFQELDAGNDHTLGLARKALARAHKEREGDRKAVSEERRRASRLAQELARLKQQRQTEASSRRHLDSTEEESLAFAAAGAEDAESRVLDLEAQLAYQRERADRFARYVEAMEARLMSLADGPALEQPDVVPLRSGRRASD